MYLKHWHAICYLLGKQSRIDILLINSFKRSDENAKGVKVMAIKNVAVIGTGLIGSSWATLFASKNLNVKIYDINREALMLMLPCFVTELLS